MLYLILLRYRAPLAEIDRHVEAHRAWLHAHYAAGHFLLSGPQEPRLGGAILARGAAREEVAGWIAGDPFHAAGVAEYEIVGWRPLLRDARLPVEFAPEAAAGVAP